MAIECRIHDGRIIQAAEHVGVVAEAGQGAQTWCKVVVRTCPIRNPVPFRNAVAVEPEHEPALHRHGEFARVGLGSIGGACRIEHGNQRRQADQHRRLRQRYAFEEDSAREPTSFRDDVRH
jgi:hypothetical protein